MAKPIPITAGLKDPISLLWFLNGHVLLHIASYFILTTALLDGYCALIPQWMAKEGFEPSSL